MNKLLNKKLSIGTAQIGFNYGAFNKGKRIGIWEISYIYHNRDKPIKIQVGNYSNGKKEGVWKTIIFGQTITKHSWNKGDL